MSVVSTSSSSKRSSVTFTRPSNATAYTAGDAVGSTDGSAILEFTNIGTSGSTIMITDAMFEIDVSAVPAGMSTFYLRLYNAMPTSIADNAAWDLPSGDRSKFLGTLTLSTPSDLGSTLISDNTQLNKTITLSGTSLYAVLVTSAAFTPTSAAVKKITLYALEL